MASRTLPATATSFTVVIGSKQMLHGNSGTGVTERRARKICTRILGQYTSPDKDIAVPSSSSSLLSPSSSASSSLSVTLAWSSATE